MSPAVPRPGKTQADATNAPGTTFCPSASPDREYIFYPAHRDIYRVSAILEPLGANARR